MKIPLAVSLVLSVALGLAAATDEARPAAPDDSMAHVLKAGQFYDLAVELGDQTEAGQDQAAKLMAHAKRIETEARIGSNSMRRVVVLDDWREAINDWNDVQLELAWFRNGYGTLYYHLMERNDYTNEDFLARLADDLPLTGKPLTKETALKIDGLIKKAQQRLAQVTAQFKRSGKKPVLPLPLLARRIEDARAALKSQFQYAGDAATTELLLDYCKEPVELWDLE